LVSRTTGSAKGWTVPVFSSAEEAEKVYAAFFEHITMHPELRPKFVEAGSAFRANYTDPDSAVSIDASSNPPVVKVGDAARAARVDVQLFMSADDGHKFWLGDLNIPMAMARRKVRIEGSVGTLLGLLPAVRPAFAMYREFLVGQGMADKLPD
jgi:putative sterol carrier protein